MKKQQKPGYSKNTQKHRLLVSIRVHSWFQRIKNMKNKANFTSLKITASPYSRTTYNYLSTKTQNGTKPNKANLKPILARRPVGVVVFNKKRKIPPLNPNPYPLTPNNRIPSLFPDKPLKSHNLFMGFKPNFPDQRNTANSCCESAYSNLLPKFRQKNKPNTNPNKANFFTTPRPHFSEELFPVTRARKMSISYTLPQILNTSINAKISKNRIPKVKNAELFDNQSCLRIWHNYCNNHLRTDTAHAVSARIAWNGPGYTGKRSIKWIQMSKTYSKTLPRPLTSLRFSQSIPPGTSPHRTFSQATRIYIRK